MLEMETSRPPPAVLPGGKNKIALEFDDEPPFVAIKDGGAYDAVEMPKRFKFPEALDGEDARTTAMYVRVMMMNRAYRRARAAAPP